MRIVAWQYRMKSACYNQIHKYIVPKIITQASTYVYHIYYTCKCHTLTYILYVYSSFERSMCNNRAPSHSYAFAVV